MLTWSQLGSLGWFTAFVLTSAVSVLLRNRIPVATLSPKLSSFDDSLFIRQATHLANGQWLGPFDSLTLAKGASYPMLIAFSHKLSIPLKVSEQLTWLLAALCLASCVWMLTRGKLRAFVVYAVLAFDPTNFSSGSAQVLRDSWASSLGLLFVSTFFLGVYCAVIQARRHWTLLSSALAGMSGAAFFLCREEGAWIAPSLLVIGIGLPLAAVLEWRWELSRDRPRLLHLAGRLGLVFLVAGTALCLPILFVVSENSRRYGSALTTDMGSGQILRSYTDWTRVQAGRQRPHVPISHSQRDAVYRVSPAARELKPYLEDVHNLWRRIGCSKIEICDDFAGAWTIWALRDAAASAGRFHSETEAQAFFGALSREIDTACDNGKLTCAGRLPTALQGVQRTSPSEILFSSIKFLTAITWNPEWTVLQSTPYPLSQTEREVVRSVVGGVASSTFSEAAQMRKFKSQNESYILIATIYQPLFPVLIALAVPGFLVGLRAHGKKVSVAILLGALAVGVLSRVILIAIIDTTDFAADGRYLLPARQFLLAFGIVGSLCVIEDFADMFRRRFRQPSEAAELNRGRLTRQS